MRSFGKILLLFGLAMFCQPVWGQATGSVRSGSQAGDADPPLPQPDRELNPRATSPETSPDGGPRSSSSVPAPYVPQQSRHSRHRHPHRVWPGGGLIPSGSATPADPAFGNGSARSPFSERLLQRRMGLIGRLRSSAEQSGNAQMAGQADQLELLVRKVHAEGPEGVIQLLGKFLSQRSQRDGAGGDSPSAPGVELGAPAVDLGEAQPLPGAPNDSPPKPDSNGTPESGADAPPSGTPPGQGSSSPPESTPKLP